MPTYNYKCEGSCGREYEMFHTVAERKDEFCCGYRSEHLISSTTLVGLFTPHTYEDITTHPIEVTSKKQLKELCKVHNVRAARLD